MEGVFKWIIVGSVIIGTIIALIIIWLALSGTVKYEMQTYTAVNDNTALDIEIEAGALRTEYYYGDKIQVEYPVSKSFRSNIYEKDGTFHFKNDFRAFFILFVNPKIPDIVIKLPHGAYYDINLGMSAGKVNLAGGRFGKAELQMSAGTLKGEGMDCSSLKLKISAGAAALGRVNCHSLDMHMSAGSASIDRVTCTDTKLRVSAGSVKLGYTGLSEEYRIIKHVSVGSCNVAAQNGITDKTIDINVSAGSVKLDFGV